MTAIFERDTLSRLHRVLASDQLPDKARAWGERLLRRLRAPVRLIVAGPAGSGKSELVRLLAGCPPATAVQGGAEVVSETPSLVLPNLVVIEHALPRAGGSAGGAASIEAVLPDIILWCTQGFTHDEAQVWAQVPDTLKDHAFLVLTKADELARLGVLQDRLADLRGVVETEFHSLLPIATRLAVAARDGTAITDPALHARSGAAALFAALERMIDQGRSADLDAADLFVRRYGGTLPEGGPDSPTPRTAPAPLPAAASEPTWSVPAAAPVLAESDAPADTDARLSEAAIRFLDGVREDFPDEIGPDDPGAVSALLALCARTAERLAEIVTEGTEVSEDLAEDVLEASEMMTLLALEDNESAAADAVTLLLQLRRGFETRLCT